MRAGDLGISRVIKDVASSLTDLVEPWMTAAIATGELALGSFVTGLRADQDAVTAGLSLPWSSGAVEGHVTASRCSNDKMYGRASPDLLRLRVLAD